MTEPRLKWRLASALQKCCRRGNASLAGRLAADLVDAAGPWYANHRLQIIALEDCFGQPELACQAVLDARNPAAMRMQLGEAPAASALAQRLALLPKCRVATDVLLTLHTPETMALAAKFAGHPVHPVVARVAKIEDKSLEGFQRAVTLAASIVSQADGELIDEVTGEEPLVAGLPASSFDWHCQEGRRSFAYFSKACNGAREFFDRNPQLDKIRALGTVAFEREGRLCYRLLTSPLIREVRKHALHSHALPWAGLNVQQYDELCGIVGENMPLLHKARARVVASIDAEAAARAAQRDSDPTPTTPPSQGDLPLPGAPTKPTESKQEDPHGPDD